MGNLLKYKFNALTGRFDVVSETIVDINNPVSSDFVLNDSSVGGANITQALNSLLTSLAGKSNVGHIHVEADIVDLDKYSQAQINLLLGGKSSVGHNHVEADIIDLDKYTTTEVDNLLLQKANVLHGGNHESGGVDEINVSALLGELANAQKVQVEKNNISVGIQKILNFIEGTNTTINVTESGGKINIEISALGGSGSVAKLEDIGDVPSYPSNGIENILQEVNGVLSWQTKPSSSLTGLTIRKRAEVTAIPNLNVAVRTVVPFETLDYNQNNFYNVSNDGVIVPVAGDYLVAAWIDQVYISGTSIGCNCAIQIQVDGVDVGPMGQMAYIRDSGHRNTTSFVYYRLPALPANAEIKVTVQNRTLNTYNAQINIQDSQQTFLTVTKLDDIVLTPPSIVFPANSQVFSFEQNTNNTINCVASGQVYVWDLVGEPLGISIDTSGVITISNTTLLGSHVFSVIAYNTSGGSIPVSITVQITPQAIVFDQLTNRWIAESLTGIDGSNVTSWSDTISSNLLIQTTVSAQMQLFNSVASLNNKKSLLSSTDDTMVMISPISFAGEFNIFVIAEVTVGVQFQNRRLIGQTSNANFIGLNEGTTPVVSTRINGTTYQTPITPVLGKNNIIQLSRNASNQIIIRFNDDPAITLGTNAGVFTINCIGYTDQAWQAWQGYIAEILCYSKKLSVLEENQMINHLENYYGIGI